MVRGIQNLRTVTLVQLLSVHEADQKYICVLSLDVTNLEVSSLGNCEGFCSKIRFTFA